MINEIVYMSVYMYKSVIHLNQTFDTPVFLSEDPNTNRIILANRYDSHMWY